MGSRLKYERIEHFKSNLELLRRYEYADSTIGDEMGIGKANFSKYVSENNTLPITEKFLDKFYAAWGERLTEMYRDQIIAYPDVALDSLVGEFQGGAETKGDQMLILLKRYEKVMEVNQKMYYANQKMAEETRKQIQAIMSPKDNLQQNLDNQPAEG